VFFKHNFVQLQLNSFSKPQCFFFLPFSGDLVSCLHEVLATSCYHIPQPLLQLVSHSLIYSVELSQLNQSNLQEVNPKSFEKTQIVAVAVAGI